MTTTRRKYDDYISRAKAVIAQYKGRWTIRQVFYRMLPWLSHDFQGYQNIQKMLKKARDRGDVDPERFEDLTRALVPPATPSVPMTTDAPPEWLRSLLLPNLDKLYTFDHWTEQPRYVEVWVEKDAVLGIALDALEDLDVPVLSCRGFASLTSVRDGAHRFAERGEANGKALHILYVGDFDPSGEYMAHELPPRLEAWGASEVFFKKICLLADQIDDLPENYEPEKPKKNDPRYQWFKKMYPGMGQYELDALPPQDLHDIIRAETRALLDVEVWERTHDLERGYKEQLASIGQELIEVVPS